jgi:pyruvate, orthophosphate dikinase
MVRQGTNIYRFGKDVVDGDGTMTEILGGKGAGLAEMTRLLIPVPPGFTIPTDLCRSYLELKRLPSDFEKDLQRAINRLEKQTGRRFGAAHDPLLISVRSGAPVSMPGMMDTVLNVGLNDSCVQGLAARSQSQVFALDCYRRLIQMFGSVVLNVPKEAFDEVAEDVRGGHQKDTQRDFTERELGILISAYQNVVKSHAGIPFPQEAGVQLSMAVEAVFRSWESERAKFYRRINGIHEKMGTAVTVQAMVFGNMSEDSGTGVGFTRNPSTGEACVFGEYLQNAQGEDIVAGLRTPMPVSQLKEQMSAVYFELLELTGNLERHYKDVQDFEFTVERGRLYLLQTRVAKRSALGAVKIAVDMANEGLITREEAVRRVKPSQIIEILSPQLDFAGVEGEVHAAPLTTGLPASPGAAVGTIAFSSEDAVRRSAKGESVILVTQETTADDIEGMHASVGLLTARGGATSHAAVVARGMGKCCISGAHEISVDAKNKVLRVREETFGEGDFLSLDGNTGSVFSGALPMRPATEQHPAVDELLGWALALPGCRVRANADTPEDATAAIASGATGIGLCRTEHMFFASDRLPHIRAMILAKDLKERRSALAALLPIQQNDFEKLFLTVSPLPVTIRLLDPPLHEFLPSPRSLDEEIGSARADEDWELAMSLEVLRGQVEALSESNPMMGHRGCRLSLTYPEILQMQVRAILLAALKAEEEGAEPKPEIMVPLVSSEGEMQALARLIHETAETVFAEQRKRIDYKLGTMIELPRAAVCAGAIAQHVSFISFGTNDLTQMTYGFSRDDSHTYLDSYLDQGIFQVDPFVTIDRQGVGVLMQMAVRSVRDVDPQIKIGVCGEHGGDPESIKLFHLIGADYVSCSPSRLRVAQLAAAQACEPL